MSGDSEELIENGKNKFAFRCTQCPSKILGPQLAAYVEETNELPLASQKRGSDQVETETISKWVVVADMYIFDNIGFTNSVENVKYLTCADCEFGPIGWFDTENRKSFVALSRVKHEFSVSTDSTETENTENATGQ